MSITIHGYSPVGPDTYGAEYARANPDDLPNDIKAALASDNPPAPQQVGPYRYVVGGRYYVLGICATCVGIKPGMRIALDTRQATAAVLEATLPQGRLFFWRGGYWWVKEVHGVTVVLTYWGAKRRRDGWVTWVRDGKEFARKER